MWRYTKKKTGYLIFFYYIKVTPPHLFIDLIRAKLDKTEGNS